MIPYDGRYITLNELYAYFDYLTTTEGGEDAAEKALQSLEAYEGYAKHLIDLPSRSPAFAKRVKDLFAYIEKSINNRNKDGHITTEDLVAFFGETGTEKEGDSNARYWLEQIDGHGNNTGYITQQEMFEYFDSLGGLEEAVPALEALEAYEGYEADWDDDDSAAVVDLPAAAASPAAAGDLDVIGEEIDDEDTTAYVDRSGPFWKRVKSLFLYMEGAIDERNDKGYISTDDLIKFFWRIHGRP